MTRTRTVARLLLDKGYGQPVTFDEGDGAKGAPVAWEEAGTCCADVCTPGAMTFWRTDPGECIVCGAAHCACGGGPIEVVQLPARDAAAAAQPRPLQAEIVQAMLPPGQCTTGTYRRATRAGGGTKGGTS